MPLLLKGLYRAFRELGRVERTLFLLEFISDPSMRQHIRAETTKVENYHQFTDWIAFGGPVLRSGDPVEQEKRIKYRTSRRERATSGNKAVAISV